MIVGDLGERKLIERIREVVELYAGTPISRDDAAILDLSDHSRVVLTTDRVPVDLLSLRAGLMTMEDLGRYVVEVNVSDLVATAAQPIGFLLNLGMPPSLPVEAFEALITGVVRRTVEVGAPLIGGDTKSAPELQIVGVGVGEIPVGMAPVHRSSAAPGDELRVSGTLGAFGAALAYFFREDRRRRLPKPLESRLVTKLVRPRARLDLLPEVNKTCSACIDITDGLTESVLELERASGCEFEIDSTLLPIDPLVEEVALFLNVDAIDVVLGIGLDLELLHCSRTKLKMSDSTKIGFATDRSGRGSRILRDSRWLPLQPKVGFEHLAGDAASYITH